MLMEQVWLNRRDCTSHCSDCPGCDSPYPLGGIGDSDADIMLIGKEPAYNVDNDSVEIEMKWDAAKFMLTLNREKSRNPLWKHMENVAEVAECEPYDLYFTNVAKCNNDSMFGERSSHCKDYLRDEILEVDPETILLHGSKVINVVYSFLGLPRPSAVGPVHGTVVDAGRYTLLPLYHWGFAYRQHSVEEYDQTVREAIQMTK